jgi:hypothetical protein
MEGYTERRYAQGRDEVSHIYEYLNGVTTRYCETPAKYIDQRVNVTIGSKDRHIAFTTLAYAPVGGGQSNIFYTYCQDDNCFTNITSDVIDCPTNAYEDGTHSYAIDRKGNQDTTYTTVTSPSPSWTVTTEVHQLFREDGIKFYFQYLAKTTTEYVMENSKQISNRTESVDIVVNSWGAPVTGSNYLKVQDNFLSQNVPNPFQTETAISYSLLKPGTVRISVIDLYGREVNVLENSYKKNGNHTVNFNAAGLNPGIYFCKLACDGFSSVRKMLLTE